MMHYEIILFSNGKMLHKCTLRVILVFYPQEIFLDVKKLTFHFSCMHLNGEGLVIDFIVDLRILLQRLFDKI